MIKLFYTIMSIVMELIAIYFLLSGFIFNLSESLYYFILGIIFFVFGTIFIITEKTVGLEDKIEENNRGLWSLDRKIDAMLDEFEKVKKNVHTRKK